MSESTAPVPPPSYGYGAGAPAPVVTEKVGAGLAASLGAVLGGCVLAVVLWRLGFIASLSSFLIAGGAVFLYSRAAGTPPRKGLPALIAVIVVGVVISFFCVVASDLWTVYDKLQVGSTGESRVTFIQDNLFRGKVLGTYGSDMFMFVLFAALGIFSTLRRLVAAR